nr:MAG TPA: hypothetical protein [Caudoviricetes sp.]
MLIAGNSHVDNPQLIFYIIFNNKDKGGEIYEI